MIGSLFSNLLRDLLPYLMCLLYGCRLNASLRAGDPLIRMNVEGCLEEHRLLESIGRGYWHVLKSLLASALELGMLKRTIDLSIDPTHLVYWGKKMVKRWGTPFSTTKNRSLPGLYPLTCFDLLSGLFLLMSAFIGKSRRDRRGRVKNAGKIVATKVMRCIDLLKDAGIRVRSLTGDEGIVSAELLGQLGREGIEHLFAVSSRSELRKLVPTIDGWRKLDDGRLIGIVRGVAYKEDSTTTNLVAVKDERSRRTFLYISSYCKGAKYVWSRYCRRGRHENGIGLAKSLGFEDRRPSTNLFQVKGHALACLYLIMLLKALSQSLNLDPNTEPQTLRNLLNRQCYVRWEGGKLVGLVIVSRSLLARIGATRIEWEGGAIELAWYQERNGQEATKIRAKG